MYPSMLGGYVEGTIWTELQSDKNWDRIERLTIVTDDDSYEVEEAYVTYQPFQVAIKKPPVDEQTLRDAFLVTTIDGEVDSYDVWDVESHGNTTVCYV